MTPQKLRLATVWLDGCSGCHMSVLDLDERLIELAQRVDVVYSPLVDVKRFPDDVDICLVEGAVATTDDLHKLRRVRQATRNLVALGDCAVTGNVPAMRNTFGAKQTLERVYLDKASRAFQVPNEVIPALLSRVVPLHEVVPVDLHLPGCPPPADAIYDTLTALINGEEPEPLRLTRFGR